MTAERILFIQHQDDCPPGFIGERAQQRGFEVDIVAATDELPDPRGYQFIVPLGSDDAAYDDSVPYLQQEAALLRLAVDHEVPVFGICFGAQLLSRVLGGDVRAAAPGPEIGWLRLDTTDAALVDPGPWLVWHLDVMTCPPGGESVARTDGGVQAFTHGPHLGVQFHPEATQPSVEVWSHRYRSSLVGLGIEPGDLIEETRLGQPAARERAYRLFDRAYARASSYCP
ncbi:MAG: type 1 glutamine amidotransferase [Actinomycetota bacterium]|nr:type 1 glutamine amidotransferase [Actinomycetota bacterium]